MAMMTPTFAWVKRTPDLSCPDFPLAQGPSHLHVKPYLRVAHAMCIANSFTVLMGIPNNCFFPAPVQRITRAHRPPSAMCFGTT